MSTDSIGSNSRDHTNVADWWAAIPTTLTENETGECYNDSEFAVTTGYTLTGKTEGAHQITLTTAAGESLVDDKTNPLRYDQSLGVGFAITGTYSSIIADAADGLIISKLQFKNSTGNGLALVNRHNVNTLVERCVFQVNNNSYAIKSDYSSSRNNCIVVNSTTQGYDGQLFLRYGSDAWFNTICVPADLTSALELIEGGTSGCIVQNHAAFGSSVASVGTFDTTNSKYNATDDTAITGTNALTSLTYANQFNNSASSATMDLRVKAGSDLIAAGVAVAGITTDIFGTTRANPPTIGCFEYESTATRPIKFTGYGGGFVGEGGGFAG